MGYVFANIDSDNDDLIDGTERTIGTNHNDPDSDDDYLCDGREYQPYGLMSSNPRFADTSGVFISGFEDSNPCAR